MERYCMIVNPTAASGAAKDSAAKAAEYLKRRGADLTVYETERPGHATELAAKAVRKGFDCVIAAGGDGTVREAALSLLHSDTAFGILPCGTGNDFVKTFGISTEMESACETLLCGENRRIDAGEANGEFFINVAGFGFDVDVLDNTDALKAKFKNGSTAYFAGLLKALFGLKLRKSVVTFPDGTIEKNVLLIAAGNGRFFGGGMEVAPMADPSDGLLDVCIIHDINFFSALGVLPKFMKGRHVGTPYVTYRKEKWASVTCEPASRIEVDGERMDGTPVTFRILEKALKMRVPKAEPVQA